MAERFDGKFERISPELKKMTQLMKQPSKKYPSDQRVCILAVIECVALKSISFHSINRTLFREMLECADPDLSVPVYDTLRPHIKHLVDV
jgi:hypothetical protein